MMKFKRWKKMIVMLIVATMFLQSVVVYADDGSLTPVVETETETPTTTNDESMPAEAPGATTPDGMPAETPDTMTSGGTPAEAPGAITSDGTMTEAPDVTTPEEGMPGETTKKVNSPGKGLDEKLLETESVNEIVDFSEDEIADAVNKVAEQLQNLGDRFGAFQEEFFENLTGDEEDPMADFVLSAAGKFGEEFNALLEQYRAIPVEVKESESAETYADLEYALENLAAAMGGDLNNGVNLLIAAGTHTITIHYQYPNGNHRSIGSETCTFSSPLTGGDGWGYTIPSHTKYQSQFPSGYVFDHVEYAWDGNNHGYVTEGQRINIYSTGMAVYFVLKADDSSSGDGGNGGGNSGSGSGNQGSGSYSMSCTIIYHSNYPGGTDYTQKYNYTYYATYNISGTSMRLETFDGLGFTVPDGYELATSPWNTKADGSGEKANQLFYCKKGTTYHLYAQYTEKPKNTFTLKFNGNGGTVNKENIYTVTSPETSASSYDFAYIRPDTRTGYEFVGWATTSGASSSNVSFPYTVNSDNDGKTLYAVWRSISTVKLSYDANGGSNPPAAQEVNPGSLVYVAGKGSMTNGSSEFLGWSTSKTGTVAYDPGDPITVDTDTTLYAIWKATTADYTVRWFDTDGTELKASETRKGTVGNTVSATSDDKKINNYEYRQKLSTESAKLASSGTVLTLRFAKLISAKWMDGYTDTPIKTENVAKDISDAALNDLYPSEPTREGYKFNGWDVVRDTTTGDITITAKWTSGKPDKPNAAELYDTTFKLQCRDKSGHNTTMHLVAKDSNNLYNEWNPDWCTYPNAVEQNGDTYTYTVTLHASYWVNWYGRSHVKADGQAEDVPVVFTWNADSKTWVCSSTPIVIYMQGEKQTYIWYDEDGETELDRQAVSKCLNGLTASDYKGEQPTKAETADYTYEFKEWEGPTTDTDGNITYKATYTEIPKGEPVLSITKTVDRASVKVGNPLTYTITVENKGTADATEVKVSDTLPMELDAGSIESTPDWDSSKKVDGGKVRYIWELGTIKADETKTVEFTVKTKTAGKIENSASVTSDEVTTPVPTDPENPAKTTIYDLSVTKSNNGFHVDQDTGIASVRYTVTVTNNSGFSLHGLDIIDTLTKVEVKDISNALVDTVEMTLEPVSLQLGENDIETLGEKSNLEANQADQARTWNVLPRSTEFVDGDTITLIYDIEIVNNGTTGVNVALTNKAKGGSWTTAENGTGTVRKILRRMFLGTARNSDPYDAVDEATSGSSLDTTSAGGYIPATRKFSLAYDFNGGKNGPAAQNFSTTQDSTTSHDFEVAGIESPVVIPENGNKVFKGWSETKDGAVTYAYDSETKAYSPAKVTVELETGKNAASKTLYAVWEDIPERTITVKYWAEGADKEKDEPLKTETIAIINNKPIVDGDKYKESELVGEEDITGPDGKHYVIETKPSGEEKTVAGDVVIEVTCTPDTVVDPDNDSNGDKPGDGIPDKYQKTVTYKVLNGTWSDGTADDIEKVFSLKVKGADGNLADKTDVTLGDSIPEGMIADTANGYDQDNGAWNVEISGSTAVSDDVTYTYTFEAAETKTVLTIKVKGTSAAEVYDGNEKTVSGYTLTVKDKDGKEIPLPAGLSVTPDTDDCAVSGTDAGTYQMGLSKDNFSLTGTDADKYDVTFEVEDGILIITKDDTLTVGAGKVETTYDGEEHPVTPVVNDPDATVTIEYQRVDEDGNPIGDPFDEAPTDAGTYIAKITAELDGTEVTSEAEVIISRRKLTVITGSGSKTFDNTPLTNSTATVTVAGGAVKNEAITATATGSQTAVGSSTNGYEIDWDALGINPDNYEITEVLGTLTVNASTPTTPTTPPTEEGGGETGGGGTGGGGGTPDSTPTPGPEPTPIVPEPVPLADPVPTVTPAATPVAPTPTAAVPAAEAAEAEGPAIEALEDEEVPLAAGDDEEAPELAALNEEEVPLAAGEGRSWALLNFALMNLAIFESLMLLIGYFTKTKNDEEERKLKKKGLFRILSIPVAVISLIAFILTEDITLPTGFVDKYTIVMLIIAVVQTVMVVLSNKKYEDEEEA